MTVERFFESLVSPYDNNNIVLYDECERVIAEYNFTRDTENLTCLVNDLRNRFGDCKIFNFYAEPHWSYTKTGTMIYHLFV